VSPLQCTSGVQSCRSAARGVMMGCNRRAEACAATVRAEATERRVSAATSPDRFPPNSGSTAPLLGNTDSGHCVYRMAHDRIRVVDTHEIFPTEKAAAGG
jgi:hypothetical protein